MLEFAQFLGPLGGLLCISWAMGAIAGYAFHRKTIHQMHRKIAETKYTAFEERIEHLTNLNKELMFRNVVLEERHNQYVSN